MKVGYLINQYPKVSHSFVRREINALERAGLEICRYSIRSLQDELVDAEDNQEYEKTRFLITKRFPGNAIASFFKQLPGLGTLIRAVSLTVQTGWRSESGLLRHFIFFLEACVLAEWCKKEQVQHLHAHFGTNSATVAMLTGLLAKMPYSFTVHGPEEFDKPAFISLGEKIKRSAFVVGISSYGKSQLYRQLESEYWDKVQVVHCGLDQGFYSGEVAPVPEQKNLVCVGRLCEQKGQLLLIKAAKVLFDEGLEFTLKLVGDGPMRAEVEALINEYHLNSMCEITGWMSSGAVRHELEQSRALVLPSFAEGLPVVIMESMALSRPVVSTYIAGIPELVKPGESGWLVPAGSIQELVDAMREVLTISVENLSEIGERARSRVLERHNIDTEAAKLKNLFDSAITSYSSKQETE